jgi:hypothetical protein
VIALATIDLWCTLTSRLWPLLPVPSRAILFGSKLGSIGTEGENLPRKRDWEAGGKIATGLEKYHVMAEERKIPRELEEAFHTAVWGFDDNRTENPDPKVGKFDSITAVCESVRGFDDPLPDTLINILCTHLDDTTTDRAELLQDRSYRNGAHILRGLVERRRLQR